ncbi:MAG TPA: nucleoside triphosphate pyrophosphohydrolase [Deltaproteobacteria bacterium]|nr:MAG: nucleoside triphosphate pyrophosphohydrolase [Deltaproteobacteria bacterium GWA2_55_82]OGQ63371.1 MAG: nucleoside triphosphate pyrophosphohydrolase [Deltaproteobacteria bacterium RIFCSPLOWO2_02_FULL_55_12]OIJ73216.1 MAG: nucleoside triphosphate pyrophosphohydrolase [Deltaproteobacteria bacterium GWC2_55_46]HBG45524.1 nucleoside triphosphate pyrophosphohydrolase [Deltaproteobacteria bacterium]HCY10355.1 nucleoside triphosphate pyrophosphohydrolase [Deltaproteobacteria bacterium]
MENRIADIGKLEALMERLRGEDGCPWDRAQTFDSLIPFIIEEAYEVISAIDSGDARHMKEELGDLLFQIIFVCQMAKEKGLFSLSGVIEDSHRKMTGRHPHVFGQSKADTPEEVLRQWAEIKKLEKKGEEAKGYLEGIPEVLPALLRAHKVSQKAARAGFDWKDVSEVLVKLDEEVAEFKDAVRQRAAAHMEEELGDLLFTLVNVGRFLEVNPEDALRKTIGKFITRFHHIERSLIERGGGLSSTTIDEMERLWQEAKAKEKER